MFKKHWLILFGIVFGMACCGPCMGMGIVMNGTMQMVNVDYGNSTVIDLISVEEQENGTYGPGGTASVLEYVNTSNGINITIYRLYNGTGLACNLSSTPIDPLKPEPTTEPLIEPLLIAMDDNNSNIRYLAARALGDIKSTVAIDPLINALNDSDSSVQSISLVSLYKITGVDLGKDQNSWIEWRQGTTA
ncbi:MAG TPA: HEAT repeat domain-containing protein [Methanothrix sp.]|nr:HEAT repeat domain-containing protein [Methanothrix sp.]